MKPKRRQIWPLKSRDDAERVLPWSGMTVNSRVKFGVVDSTKKSLTFKGHIIRYGSLLHSRVVFRKARLQNIFWARN